MPVQCVIKKSGVCSVACNMLLVLPAIMITLNGIAVDLNWTHWLDMENILGPTVGQTYINLLRTLLLPREAIPELVERLEAAADNLSSLVKPLKQGIDGTCTSDTLSLKRVVIDWITPAGEALTPPLSKTTNKGRGFDHVITGQLPCPCELDWEEDNIYLKKLILLSLRHTKHVFILLSSVAGDTSHHSTTGNAAWHAMSSVTPASITYIVTQIRFVLSSTYWVFWYWSFTIL
ncbi:uncharacterized protein B0H18DRAFT_958319 [Fomitopsis serialis]|uniref:uncharacterized protein n=1 Tax=Fomitopsis serialis TaxID=139415 RepID=UPI002007B415|nr:uncharacterized protein B0H18DRAFT_958319 [Neoantrodia serialis]KAH9917568.1 hypothetical protein B0H18DRAFT_958319 [Neoantrodia serialis]